MGHTIAEQRKICAKYGAAFVPAPADKNVGIAFNVKHGIKPINGLRHIPEVGTTGWFIWGGTEISDAVDFFVPLHVAHLSEWCPEIIRFLGLPAGWRFLFADDYEDVWQDPKLLET